VETLVTLLVLACWLVSSALLRDVGLYSISAGPQVTMTDILLDIPQALQDVISYSK